MRTVWVLVCHLSRIGCSTTWRPCYQKPLCVYQGYIKRKDQSWSCQLCMYPFLYWMHSKLTLLAQWAWLVVALHRWMMGLLFCRTEIGVSVQIWACHLVVGVSHGGWAPVGWLSDQLHIGWFLHFQVCTVYHLGWFFLCVLHGKRLQGSWQCVHRSGILYWVNYPLGAFCQPDEPPCLYFCSCSRNDSGSCHFLSKVERSAKFISSHRVHCCQGRFCG